jgi:hypothetical protein
MTQLQFRFIEYLILFLQQQIFFLLELYLKIFFYPFILFTDNLQLQFCLLFRGQLYLFSNEIIFVLFYVFAYICRHFEFNHTIFIDVNRIDGVDHISHQFCWLIEKDIQVFRLAHLLSANLIDISAEIFLRSEGNTKIIAV